MQWGIDVPIALWLLGSPSLVFPLQALLIAKAVRVIRVVSGIRHPVTSLSYPPLTIASLGMTLAIQLTSELVPHVAPSFDAFLYWSVRLHDLQFVFCAGQASAGRPLICPLPNSMPQAVRMWESPGRGSAKCWTVLATRSSYLRRRSRASSSNRHDWQSQTSSPLRWRN